MILDFNNITLLPFILQIYKDKFLLFIALYDIYFLFYSSIDIIILTSNKI